MTFSLAAHCQRTGRFGVVVTSSSPAVAARCAFVRAGTGAACSQNITDPRLGGRLLDALAEGHDPYEAMTRLVRDEPHAPWRQLTVVDAEGRTAVHSGAHTLGTHAEARAPHAVAAGNLLADRGVPDAMLAAFAARPAAPLGRRLVEALAAGQAAGGESGPVHSAGLLVSDGPGGVGWPVTDLRVDWSDGDPVAELGALWERWQPQEEDYLRRALDPADSPGYGVPGDERGSA
ncbi:MULTISPECIES: DUF1028 domain-containing protein [Streptomyces]|uniref:DUF1028 domain-containing protein n=1 Tax=Streptomyces TaxID=1883 RepID=UPI0004C9CBB6|nr:MULTISPECIES: DUF1028 domain-containing protein [unclassified Streptomyces]QHF98567.1 DUF1028 domain-containing protein [Streptomyces sp. NHF165]